jgi:hypothetical protein
LARSESASAVKPELECLSERLVWLSWKQHPRIPVNIEWTSADVNRYPDMVPPNAMSYGDMVVFLHPVVFCVV